MICADDLLDLCIVDFRDLNAQNLLMVLDWRNDKRIRRQMLSSDIISIEDHLNFVNSLYNDFTKCYFLIKHNNMNIGVVDFYDVKRKTNSNDIYSAWWGYYLNPALLGKGYGLILEEWVLWKAFKWNTLLCETLVSNESVWKLHERYGFKKIKRNKVNDTYIMCMDMEQFEKEHKNKNL